MMVIMKTLILIAFALEARIGNGKERPNIIFILADDLGWNDVSFHGSDEIPTPNIDALAYNGVILNSHYVAPICTPSRSALMTGKYPMRIGMQGQPLHGAEPRGLPLEVRILPEYLKELGYKTHAIGKWHLGFCQKEYTPVHRGFDTHLGYWGGQISYYSHLMKDTYSDGVDFNGYDMHRNACTAYDLVGRYATDLFTDEAVDIIDAHDKNAPLFLYLAHLAVHAGDMIPSLEAPQEVVNKFGYIADPNRRTYAGMVVKLDESVGRVVKALASKKMLHNSIIVFLSDNGAPTIGTFANWGSNYPLRGLKDTLLEGGVRGVAMIWSPLLRLTPRVSDQLIHLTDWLPTLYSAAGGHTSDLAGPLDGIDQWVALVDNLKSPREEILLNIDDSSGQAAIRRNNWKLIVGSIANGEYDDYYGASGGDTHPRYNISAVVNSMAGQATDLGGNNAQFHHNMPTAEALVSKLRRMATVTCPNLEYRRRPCNLATGGVCLFNLQDDPCEQNNLAEERGDRVRLLRNLLDGYRKGMVAEPDRNSDFAADPRNWNDTWTCWKDNV